MPLTGDSLRFDPDEDGVNLDQILRNATTKSLKHVHLSLPQQYILTNAGMGFGSGSESPQLKLTPAVLEEFLEAQHGSLVSFALRVGDCCWEQVAKMTNSGKSLLPLGRIETLEKLVFSSFAFPNVADLSVILRARTDSLQVLGLEFLVLGGLNAAMSAWPRSACKELASCISKLSQLVKLEINDTFFTDTDVEALLSEGLPHLRCLALTGSFGDLSAGGSNLTDKSFQTIASKCPNLQALNLEYQDRATEEGIRSILKHCLHLRELNVSRVRFSSSLKDLLKYSSNKLLLLQLGEKIPASSIRDAMVATKGRLLLTTEYQGLVDPPAEYRAAHEKSKKLVEDASNKLENPTVYNEWEALF